MGFAWAKALIFAGAYIPQPKGWGYLSNNSRDL